MSWLTGRTRALAAIIAVILVADAAALFAIDSEEFPSRWDPRVEQLASFVEDARHLRFRHPVSVEFLPEAEYARRQTTDEGELTDEDRRDITTLEGQARALGLIGKETSLLDDLNTITTEGTLAYYDDEAKNIVIRGTELTVGLRVTIVHELTHALQDQAFDLSREFDTDGANAFFRALTEGDAVRIENDYLRSLTEADRGDYGDERAKAFDDAAKELTAVAPALIQLFGAPYALGEPITRVIIEEQGVGALDSLFRNPPESDEGMVNALALLDGQKPKQVKSPALRSGEDKTDGGDFGSVAWYLVLASFVDQRVALAAVDGWGGDAYVGYRKNSQPCIRIVFVGDTPADTAEMAAALSQWKAAFTENSVVVTSTPDRVELDACEPNAVPTPRPDAASALILPAARLALLAGVLAQGLSRSLGECYTRNMVAEIPLPLTSQAAQRFLGTGPPRILQGCTSGQLK